MNNSVAFILFSFLLTVWTCSEEEAAELLNPKKGTRDSVVTYTIPAGAHSTTASAYEILEGSAIRFRVSFDSSAIYQTLVDENQADINKLYGRSDCNSTHHENSARFGWRWFGNSLELWAYAYTDSERKMEFIKTIPLNTFVLCELALTDSSYVFAVDGTSVAVARHCSDNTKGYKLYPYFGGDETAPHEITISIQELP